MYCICVVDARPTYPSPHTVSQNHCAKMACSCTAVSEGWLAAAAVGSAKPDEAGLAASADPGTALLGDCSLLRGCGAADHGLCAGGHVYARRRRASFFRRICSCCCGGGGGWVGAVECLGHSPTGHGDGNHRLGGGWWVDLGTGLAAVRVLASAAPALGRARHPVPKAHAVSPGDATIDHSRARSSAWGHGRAGDSTRHELVVP
jgi:hypothetical protein